MEPQFFLFEDGTVADSRYDGIPGQPVGTQIPRLDEFGIPIRDDQGNIEQFFTVESFDLFDGWVEIGMNEYRERITERPKETERGDDRG